MAYKVLASGNQAAASAVTIYTVPSNASTAIYSCVLTNTTTGTITVDVGLNDSVSTRIVKRVVIPSGTGKCVSIEEIIGAYSANYSIVLTPTTTTSFNYLLTGDEV